MIHLLESAKIFGKIAKFDFFEKFSFKVKTSKFKTNKCKKNGK